jgi:hypothetical protein
MPEMKPLPYHIHLLDEKPPSAKEILGAIRVIEPRQVSTVSRMFLTNVVPLYFLF